MELNQQIVSELSKKLSLKPEVLSTVLTSTDSEEVKGVLSKVNALHVFDESQLQSRDTNMRNEGKSEGIKEGVINTYDANDKRLIEKYGVAKKDGEKLPDFIDRIINEKASSNTKPSEEIKRLQDQYSEKDAALKSALAENQKYADEKSKAERKLEVMKTLLPAVYSFQPADEENATAQFEFALWKLEQDVDFDIKDGKRVVIKKATGEVIKDTKTADPIDFKPFLNEKMPSIMKLKETKVPKNGTGLQTTAISKDGLGSINFAEYPNASALEKHLLESGHAIHDPKVQEVLSKYLESDHGKATVKPGAAVDLY